MCLPSMNCLILSQSTTGSNIPPRRNGKHVQASQYLRMVQQSSLSNHHVPMETVELLRLPRKAAQCALDCDLEVYMGMEWPSCSPKPWFVPFSKGNSPKMVFFQLSESFKFCPDVVFICFLSMVL